MNFIACFNATSLWYRWSPMIKIGIVYLAGVKKIFFEDLRTKILLYLHSKNLSVICIRNLRVILHRYGL